MDVVGADPMSHMLLYRGCVHTVEDHGRHTLLVSMWTFIGVSVSLDVWGFRADGVGGIRVVICPHILVESYWLHSSLPYWYA